MERREKFSLAFSPLSCALAVECITAAALFVKFPDWRQCALGEAPVDGAAPTSNKAPSMFALVRKMSAEDTRRGLALALDLLAAVGHGLAKNSERSE